MSSVLYPEDRFAGNFAEKIHQGKMRSGASRKRWDLHRVFSLVIYLLLVMIGLELLFHLFISERLAINHVEISVEKDFPLSNEEILALAGLTGTEYYFLVNTDLTRQRLESYPLIRSAVVTKSFPDTLKLSLSAREPLVVGMVATERGMKAILFDEEGVAFGEGNMANGETLPIISGDIIPSDLRVGAKLPREIISLLKDLKAIKASSPVLFSLISELKFVKKNSTGYEVLIYPSHHRIRVRLGQDLSERTLKYVVMVLDVLDREGIAENLEELDFRTGEIVYRVRGE